MSVAILTLCFGTEWIFTALFAINPTLAVGFIAAASTIIVSISSVLISKYKEQQITIRNQHREKKIPIYEELLTFLFKMMRAVKDQETPSDEELLDFMFSFTPKLIVWGADDVILAYLKFQKSAQNPTKLNFDIEEIWLAIRKDLGHSNCGITRGTLLSLIVSDISA